MKVTNKYKVILVGDAQVGKTSFFIRYLKNVAPRQLQPTLGVEYASKNIVLKDGIVEVQFWDTAGSEKYKALTSNYYRSAIGALLFFDLTDKDSYLHLNDWIKDINNIAGDKVVIMIVGNKLDIIEEDPDKRCVPLDEVKQFCRRKNVLYYEVSAKSGFGIKECVEQLINNIQSKNLIREPEPQPQQKTCCS